MRRQRLARTGAVIGAASALLAVGCGDEEDPRPQSVFWFVPRPAQGSSCSVTRNYQLPESARDTIISTTGEGERLVDGDDGAQVICTVRDMTGEGQSFLVDLRLQSGEIGNFRSSGQLTVGTGGTMDLSFTTIGSSLQTETCTATVDTLIPGAIWIDSLSCTDLRDPRSPNVRCDSSGGLIFENCTQ